MVTVGNPGNAPDVRSAHRGAVSYVYQIGKYEITAGQYTEFLNAVAKDDPNGLFSSHMTGAGFGAQILRTGETPNYSYSVAADWADRPVNYVSFWDAVRFCNWLHNGQPVGPQGLGTTEAGAYHDIGNEAAFGRSVGGRFFIPTVDEWYKAAYHNKAAGVASEYFDYPTGTNITPGHDITETTNPGNNMNVNLAIGAPYYRTVTGEFELSQSPYGTFDQGGNVWEWTETKWIRPSYRIQCGGSYFWTAQDSLAWAFVNNQSQAEYHTWGFRTVSVTIPEPTCAVLFTVAAFVLGFHRSQKRQLWLR
jgi:formylglycine-generating enzyme required for sulfatase activity